MYWLFGILVCLDAHLPRPGGREEELELPTGQETLTALRTGEGGGERVGCWYPGLFPFLQGAMQGCFSPSFLPSLLVALAWGISLERALSSLDMVIPPASKGSH